MSLTESKEFKIGTKAPHFNLLNVITDEFLSLNETKGAKGTVIMFICNHCPFVIHVNSELVKLADEYQQKGINFIAISSNEIENYPQDAPEFMKQVAEKNNYNFPYLFDETQEIAKEYNAACTPDFYVFDENLKAIYHGQLDDSRPKNGIPLNGKDIRQAIEYLLENKTTMGIQKPSIGCNIKWKQ